MDFNNLTNTNNSAYAGRTDVAELVRRSNSAYGQYSQVTMSSRKGVINNIRQKMMPLVNRLAGMEMRETDMGNINDKIVKLMLAIQNTPGIEDLTTEVTTGDNGMTLYEYSSYGCICSLTPSTNPCATIICNAIGMLAAGNSVIFIPHPRCVESSALTVKCIDDAVFEICGIRDLVMSVKNVDKEVTNEVMNHPDVSMIVATGSEDKTDNALYSAKRVIAASTGNPVAIIDESADMEKAAKDIVEGATFDNGLLCLAENNLVAVNTAADGLIDALQRRDAYYTNDVDEIMRLTQATVTADLTAKRIMIGKTADEILKVSGISPGRHVSLIVADTFKTHPFATCQMLMPLVPMIRTPNFETALETAYYIEQGYKHSAYIHSQSIVHLDEAANRMRTSVFIKNGSSLVALGLQGDGNTSFTIANRTGEGATTARDFARRRKCTLTSGFHIR